MVISQSEVDSGADGITVVELDGPDRGTAVFTGLFEAYRDQGFDAGYRKAVSDTLASMLLCAEEFLRHQPDHDPELRGKLYAFTEWVERRLEQRDAVEYVAGGLGI